MPGKQEKKKEGEQAKRVRPQGWAEVRQASRSVRRLAHVLRHCGEDAAKSFAVKNMLDGVLNKMLRSPEYQRFVQARSLRALTYPQRRAQKRAEKREAERQERLAAEQAAEAERFRLLTEQAVPLNQVATAETKPVNRVSRRTAAAKLKPKAKPRTKAKPRERRVIAVRGRVRPNPEKTAKPSKKEG